MPPIPFPWPHDPTVRGWWLDITWPVTPADHTTLSWMVQQFPGGPPHRSDYVTLMQHWDHDHGLTDAASPLPHWGWWFFLAIAGHHQLWRLLWRAQHHGVTLTEIHATIQLPALPGDAWWMTHPIDPPVWAHTWRTIPWPADPEWRHVLWMTAIWATWRMEFWNTWRTSSRSLNGTMTPIRGWPRWPAWDAAWRWWKPYWVQCHRASLHTVS